MKRTLTFLALAGTLCVLVVLGAVVTSKLVSRFSQSHARINRSVAGGKPWGPSRIACGGQTAHCRSLRKAAFDIRGESRTIRWAGAIPGKRYWIYLVFDAD